jgi:hypothetical protein
MTRCLNERRWNCGQSRNGWWQNQLLYVAASQQQLFEDKPPSVTTHCDRRYAPVARRLVIDTGPLVGHFCFRVDTTCALWIW